MAIYRAPRPDTQFTQIRNDVIRDERLSYRARGLLATVLSLPDDWQTSADELARRGVEGRDAVRAALTELETAGYLRRVRRQDLRGRWSTQNVIYDTPAAPQASVQEVLFPGPDSTDDGFPGVGKPAVGKPGDIQTPPTNNPSLREGAPEAEAPRNPADEVAAVIYEAMDKMGNYMALRSVAAKAIKAGRAPEAIQAVMLDLLGAGKPITGQTVYQALQSAPSGTIRNTHHDHWSNGGGFAAEEGPRA